MNNIQRLGNTLSERMAKSARAAVPTTVELGIINSNLSLTTDGLRSPIPRGSYMVNLALTADKYKTSIEDPERHDHDLPAEIRGLKAGDRVLVVWCGNEPVVVAVVVGS